MANAEWAGGAALPPCTHCRLSPTALRLFDDAERSAQYAGALTPQPSYVLASPHVVERPAGAGPPPRKRRRAACADPLRAQREGDAARRMDGWRPALEAALAAMATSLADDVPPAAAPPPAADVDPPTCGRLVAAAVSAAEAAPPGRAPALLAVAGAPPRPLAGLVHANPSALPAAAVALLPHVPGGPEPAGAHAFLLPPLCTFALSSAARLPRLLPALGEFELLIVDPPWECASASRAGHYAQMAPRLLQELPVRRLCAPGGALVALWLTNRGRTRRQAESELLPRWGLTPVAEWRWLKVDAAGAPAVPLPPPPPPPPPPSPGEGGEGGGGGGPAAAAAAPRTQRRSPAEPLLLCASAGWAPALCGGFGDGDGLGGCCAGGGGLRRRPSAGGLPASSPPPPPLSLPLPLPRAAVLVGCPGAHSRKPRLGALLARYAPRRLAGNGGGGSGGGGGGGGGGGAPPGGAAAAPRAVELFARELQAGACAWGLEPLRFQARASFREAG